MQPAFNISPKCHHYMVVQVSHLAETDTRLLRGCPSSVKTVYLFSASECRRFSSLW